MIICPWEGRRIVQATIKTTVACPVLDGLRGLHLFVWIQVFDWFIAWFAYWRFKHIVELWSKQLGFMIEIFKSGVYFGIHVNSGYFWWSFKWNQLLLLLPTIKSTLASTFVLWLGYSAAFVIASLSRASSFLPEHSNLIHSLFIISIHFWPLRLWLGPWWCGTWSWWFFRCLKLYSSISVFIRVVSHHRRL